MVIQMRRQNAGYIAYCALLIGGLATVPVPPVHAQALAGGQVQQTSAIPEAMVLVESDGDNGILAITYDRAVPHAQARQSIARLVRKAGWKLGAVSVKDEELFAPTDTGGRQSMGRQTGIEARARGLSLLQGRAFKLQPFVEAFQSMRRVDVLFLTAEIAGFTGLRSFENAALSVNLLKDGGPYRYRIDIRDHTGALPTLPIDQPAQPAQPIAPVAGSTDESGALSLGTILMIAAGAGLLSFGALRLLTAYLRHGRSGNGPGSRRPLHSGPYIVSRRKD
jgi:hypothetical protein